LLQDGHFTQVHNLRGRPHTAHIGSGTIMWPVQCSISTVGLLHVAHCRARGTQICDGVFRFPHLVHNKGLGVISFIVCRCGSLVSPQISQYTSVVIGFKSYLLLSVML
jgi:hypothetical protein